MDTYASLAALTPNDPQYQPGFEDADTSVVAAVPIYGRYDWVSAEGDGRQEFIAFLQKFVVKKPFAEHRQVYVDASSIKRVRPDAPPFFILHGQDDSIIPVREGREFAEALREVSTSTVAYAEIPHAQHAFDFYYGSPRGALHRASGGAVPVLGARDARVEWPATTRESPSVDITGRQPTAPSVDDR